MALSAPANAFNFKIDIGDTLVGVFTSATVPSGRISMIQYREGGGASAVRVIPGRVHYEPLVLRWGFGLSSLLWDWMNATMAGQLEYKNVALLMFANDGTTQTGRYDLMRCLPSAFSACELSAMSNEVAVERMEICFEELRRTLA
jgi:phage tail-like protein